MNIKDIEPWNNSNIVEFNVECFDRKMIIVFKDFYSFNSLDITKMLTDNYYDWQDDDNGYCCEEYILEFLPKEYQNNIICVIYENDKEEE